ncbi:uncharacterized protein PAE49_010531 isoform 1-T1 [Odontesthes bonariensis]|uniref:uncharacterized protein LOC142388111 n=1 Tax=Odontesthes bonariensis TaxID=219752 RepID=UPI003F583188
MPEHCAAYCCSNRRTDANRGRGITFHKFPKDKEMRTKWELALRREEFTASEASVICSEHFKPKEFDRTGQIVRLRDGVVPSVFSFSVDLQKESVPESVKVKLSANEAFCSETKSILETLMKTAVDVLTEKSATMKQNPKSKSDFESILKMLALEATRKIGCIFSQLSSLLLAENLTLTARVGQLETELKATTESCENAKMWRENVLSGCPVLFKQSGMIFTLKPCGRFEMKMDNPSQGGSDSSPADAQVEAGHDSDGGEMMIEVTSSAEQDTAVDLTTTKPKNAQEAEVRSNAKVFACEVCNKSFNRQFHLRKHMNTHKEQRPFSCDQCPRKFRNTATFEYHLLRHEELKYATFECQLCEKSFKTKRCLKTHQLVHTDTRPFVCSTCGKGFKTKHSLQAHQVVHAVEKPHKCSQCWESFRYAITLQCHQSVHTGENPYKCAVCGKAFTRRRSLRTHQAVHRGKVYTCETCGAGFTLQQNLRRHIRIHTGEKPFACKVCGKSFMQDNRLKAHMLLHGATKAFMCDLCGKTFLYNCQLKKHQAVTHDDNNEPGVKRRTRERGNRRVVYRRDKTTVNMTPFGCRTCHKGFNTAGSLKRHELIHTGNMQYSCDKCCKSFFYKATYEYHQRIHSGERPFGCDVCGKTFIIRQALKSHKLQHSGEKPHECEQCGKAFRIYTNYLRHLRIHTGEKPYECEVCGMRFRQLGHVKFHMQVHTKERPYPCSSCGLGFSDSRLLKRHICSEKYEKIPENELEMS